MTGAGLNEHDEWLGLRIEEALDPELAICDPHHHLWDHPGNRYLLDELLDDTSSGHRLAQTVFVECTSEYRPDGPRSLRPVGETEFVDSVAVASLRREPLTTRVAAGIVGQWKASIEALAACENVVVKLGGLAMPICGFGWHRQGEPPGSQTLAEAWRPYLLSCIELFGVDRCMFESNFPVDKRSCSYTVLWNAFKRLTADFSDDERRALFHDTAARVYRLIV